MQPHHRRSLYLGAALFVSALFLDLGKKSLYPQKVDQMKRGMNREWGVEPHSIGMQVKKIDRFSRVSSSCL